MRRLFALIIIVAAVVTVAAEPARAQSIWVTAVHDRLAQNGQREFQIQYVVNQIDREVEFSYPEWVDLEVTMDGQPLTLVGEYEFEFDWGTYVYRMYKVAPARDVTLVVQGRTPDRSDFNVTFETAGSSVQTRFGEFPQIYLPILSN